MSQTSYSIISFPGKDIPKQYEGYVYDRWLRMLRQHNETFKFLDTDSYYKIYHAFIEGLLQKPDSVVRFAVLSDDHDVLLGFCASREDVLDFIYVHKDYWGQKISTALIPKGITTFSHMTKLWLPIWQSKYKHWKFNSKA